MVGPLSIAEQGRIQRIHSDRAQALTPVETIIAEVCDTGRDRNALQLIAIFEGVVVHAGDGQAVDRGGDGQCAAGADVTGDGDPAVIEAVRVLRANCGGQGHAQDKRQQADHRGSS